ncbi:MAG: T9SS type A sorting domain-containing protein [Bacteroidota bacterium]
MKKQYSTRKEKLIRYSAVTGVLATAAAANAQVVYTDVNPDQMISTGNNYLLDMDNNVSPEFTIGAVAISGSASSVSYSGLGVGLQTAGTAEGAIAHAGSQFPANYADALALNTMIDNTGTFMSAPASVSQSVLIMAAKGTLGGFIPFSVGSWLGVTDQYLGLKFMIGANTHYGWARLDVAADASNFTIKDYAYNTTASQGIPAGATTVGVEETNIAQLVDLSLMNHELTVNITGSDLTNGNITVTTVTGETVINESINASTKQVSTAGLASGVYVITVKFDQGQMTEKMFIR